MVINSYKFKSKKWLYLNLVVFSDKMLVYHKSSNQSHRIIIFINHAKAKN